MPRPNHVWIYSPVSLGIAVRKAVNTCMDSGTANMLYREKPVYGFFTMYHKINRLCLGKIKLLFAGCGLTCRRS